MSRPLVLFVFLMASSLAVANADNLEQELALLAKRPQLLESEWLKLLAGRQSGRYKVQVGDTLWKISEKLFHTGFLWRKLWEENPYLTNPHSLEEGTEIRYFNGRRSLASEALGPVIRLERIKLLPNTLARIASVDGGTRINYDIKNRFIPSLFVISSEDDFLGEISGSYGAREWLSYHESIYIKSDPERVEVGKEYDLVHIDRELRDITKPGTPYIGKIVRTVGRVRVLEKDEKLFKAQIVSNRAVVSRQDKLIAVQSPVEWSLFMDPPNELQAQIIMGEDPENALLRQGQLVLLNKGKTEGMKAGFIFRVYQEKDGLTASAVGVEPASKGEVRVIHVSDLSSVGIIMKNTSPIEIGDTVIPQQAFTNPEPPPRRELLAVPIE